MPAQENDIEELLPWYVNGTLSADERQRVETHLASHPDADEEVRFLQALRASVKQTELPVDELGWRRLQRTMRADPTAETTTQATVTSISSPTWMKFAVAASLTVALLQGLYILRPADDPMAGYTTLSGGSAVAIAEGTVLAQIDFAPEATEAAIQSALQEVGATIVDGPSAIGPYRIAFSTEAGAAGEIERRLAVLAAQTSLVTHVALDE